MIRLLRWALPRLGNVVLILVSLGLGGMAWAAPPVVKTVPWWRPIHSFRTMPERQADHPEGNRRRSRGNITYTWTSAMAVRWQPGR